MSQRRCTLYLNAVQRAELYFIILIVVVVGGVGGGGGGGGVGGVGVVVLTACLELWTGYKRGGFDGSVCGLEWRTDDIYTYILYSVPDFGTRYARGYI